MITLPNATIAVYIRTSSDDMTAINTQRSVINEYLSRNFLLDGVRIAQYIDKDIPSTESHKPALYNLLEDIKEGYVDIVAVADMDRLSRNPKELEKIICDISDPHNGIDYCPRVCVIVVCNSPKKLPQDNQAAATYLLFTNDDELYDNEA